MQKPMTSEECQGYIDILNEIYAHGEQLREKVRKMHGDDAVLLIGEIMSLQQHEAEASMAARELLQSCDSSQQERALS